VRAGDTETGVGEDPLVFWLIADERAAVVPACPAPTATLVPAGAAVLVGTTVVLPTVVAVTSVWADSAVEVAGDPAVPEAELAAPPMVTGVAARIVPGVWDSLPPAGALLAAVPEAELVAWPVVTGLAA